VDPIRKLQYDLATSNRRPSQREVLSRLVLQLADAAPNGMTVTEQAAQARSWSEGFSARLPELSEM